MSGRLRVGAYLSLTGRYARFGRQAAAGLRAWQSLTDGVDLVVEDDAGEPGRVSAGLAGLARRCDLLLGPYSTQLMRAAGRAVEDVDALLWNHGGSGDDVQASPSGRVVSVLTPTSRYAEPFLRRVAGAGSPGAVWVVQGRGSFGRQVAEGAEATAAGLGLPVERHGPADPPPADWSEWDVLSAGTFEDDVSAVRSVCAGDRRPHSLCSVAAGVAAFVREVEDTAGIYGIAQWLAGEVPAPRLGPGEVEFVSAYRDLAGAEPDYPAVQAAAAAAIAVHCARSAATADPAALRSAALGLDTVTLYGRFRIDATGRQTAHRPVLVRWMEGRLRRAG